MLSIQTLAASTEYHLTQSPFNLGSTVSAFCAAASKTLYGVMDPGSNDARMGGLDNSLADAAKVLNIGGDGSTVAFTHSDYSFLVGAHVDGGTLAEADRLRVIVQEVGSHGQVLRTLNRVAAGETPSDGEFKTSGAVTLTVGTALPEGAWFRVLKLAAADIVAQTLDQYVPKEVTVYDFMNADNACRLQGD